jgi:hypothetical protein
MEEKSDLRLILDARKEATAEVAFLWLTEGDWANGRPLSRAGSLLQFNQIHLIEIGWL